MFLVAAAGVESRAELTPHDSHGISVAREETGAVLGRQAEAALHHRQKSAAAERRTLDHIQTTERCGSILAAREARAERESINRRRVRSQSDQIAAQQRQLAAGFEVGEDAAQRDFDISLERRTESPHMLEVITIGRIIRESRLHVEAFFQPLMRRPCRRTQSGYCTHPAMIQDGRVGNRIENRSYNPGLRGCPRIKIYSAPKSRQNADNVPRFPTRGPLKMQRKISRRAMVKGGLLAGALVPAFGFIANTAVADVTPLDPNDPMAKGLGFVTDATKVSAAANATYKPGQKCGTCAQFQARREMPPAAAIFLRGTPFRRAAGARFGHKSPGPDGMMGVPGPQWTRYPPPRLALQLFRICRVLGERSKLWGGVRHVIG